MPIRTASDSVAATGEGRRPTALTMLSAARTARSASSSWASGYPKRTKMPSPM